MSELVQSIRLALRGFWRRPMFFLPAALTLALAIGSNVAIAGGVDVGQNCYIGSGSSIGNGVKIGDRALIGLGSTVIRDVPADAVVVGNPARILRYSGDQDT